MEIVGPESILLMTELFIDIKLTTIMNPSFTKLTTFKYYFCSIFQIVIPGEPVKYIRSKKGNALLKDASGYTYMLSQTRIKSGTLVWRCTKNAAKYGSCKARVNSLNDEIVYRGKNDHNHEPEPY